MTDRTRTILAAVLIGAGLLWLLGALGLVSGRVLAALVAYWPLLLIGLGLDLLRERRGSGMPFTLLALLVIALLALLPSTARASEQRFSEPLGVAQEAEVRLELSRAETRLAALGSTDALIDATLADRGEIRFEVAGGERKQVTLARRGAVGLDWWPGVKGRWQIGLSPALPLDLFVDVGSGRAELDLSGLNLVSLALEGGSGSATLTLPAQAARSEVRLETGAGPTSVSAPAGANLALQVETGSGPTSFRFAEGSYLALELSSGSGPVEIDLPEGANIKLEVLDDGSGPLRLPGTLQRLSGNGDSGSWQTEGFAPGAGQFVITVRDAGSGPITLR